MGLAMGLAADDTRSASDAGFPEIRATTSFTDLPHILPWHIPIPQRVKSFTVLESVAPKSKTDFSMISRVTSSQRQIVVSGFSQLCQLGPTG